MCNTSSPLCGQLRIPTCNELCCSLGRTSAEPKKIRLPFTLPRSHSTNLCVNCHSWSTRMCWTTDRKFWRTLSVQYHGATVFQFFGFDFFVLTQVRDVQRMTGAMVKLPEDQASQGEETFVEIFASFMATMVRVRVARAGT